MFPCREKKVAVGRAREAEWMESEQRSSEFLKRDANDGLRWVDDGFLTSGGFRPYRPHRMMLIRVHVFLGTRLGV